MSNFAIFITVGIVLFVLGIIFLILSIHKDNNNEFQVATKFAVMFVISFIGATFFIAFALNICSENDELILMLIGISGMLATILCISVGAYFLQCAIDEGKSAYNLIAIIIWILGAFLFIKSPLLIETALNHCWVARL